MIQAGAYRDTREGEVVVVLGGGPSGPDDVAELTRRGEWGAVVSVNDHAARWVNAAFVVSVDVSFRLGRVLGSPVHVSPFAGDVDLAGFPVDRDWSASTALRWAEWLGAARVVLAGFDLYQGPRLYLDDTPAPDGYRAGSDHFTLAGQLAIWRRIRERLRHPERIEVVSGPLVEVFGPLDRARVLPGGRQTYSGRQRMTCAPLGFSENSTVCLSGCGHGSR
ncbi:hypothetical protein [Thalassobaculum sp.]|uniref:hypothetical protein n=1 Tax=Thalassobaculum sp. TaxID=2022740 RepID=UPI0032EDC99C